MSCDDPERTRHRQRQAELDDALAANVRPIIRRIQASGVTSLHGIAR
jgi:hypothetical protein